MTDTKLETAAILEALDATWPAKTVSTVDGWRIREGDDGGQRVSAATQLRDGSRVEDAEHAMRALGQTPLFMLTSAETALDRALQDRGYAIKDPVQLYARTIRDWPDARNPKVQSIAGWRPVEIMREMWTEAGIGPGRIRVMERAPAPKTSIIARIGQKPGGTAFVSICGNVAMIHAIVVREKLRNQGVGQNIMCRAAKWAQDNGADFLTLAVTKENGPANKLYSGLGMTPIGDYYYRIGRKDPM